MMSDDHVRNSNATMPRHGSQQEGSRELALTTTYTWATTLLSVRSGGVRYRTYLNASTGAAGLGVRYGGLFDANQAP
jgi:hypothetical protein